MKDFRNLNLFDYLGVFWRRRWYFVAVLVVTTTGTSIYAWRQPLAYKSETRILIEAPPISEEYVRQADRLSPEQQAESLRNEVQSQSFLERMVEESRLFGYGTARDFSMERAVSSLRNGIRVASTGGSVISLTYASADPQTARGIAKRLADGLVQTSTSLRRNKAVETNQFLEEELRKADRDLRAHERKIQQFKMAHLGELPEQGNANMTALTGLHSQLAAADNALGQAKDQRKLLEFRMQEQKKLGIVTRSLLSVPPPSAPNPAAPTVQPPAPNPQLAAKRAQLAELLAKYTPRHPDVVRMASELEQMERQLNQKAAADTPPAAAGNLSPLGQADAPPPAGGETRTAETEATPVDLGDAELRVEAEALNNEIDKRQRERDEILGQIKIYQGRLNLAPALEQELQTLARDHDILKTQYSSLQAKKFQSQMTTSLETSRKYETYRVLDEANLPTQPAFPNRWQMVLLGLVAGFVLGSAAAFGREYLDPTLGGEEEVAMALQLPVLVSVPEIAGGVRKKRKLLPWGKEAA